MIIINELIDWPIRPSRLSRLQRNNNEQAAELSSIFCILLPSWMAGAAETSLLLVDSSLGSPIYLSVRLPLETSERFAEAAAIVGRRRRRHSSIQIRDRTGEARTLSPPLGILASQAQRAVCWATCCSCRSPIRRPTRSLQ